MVLGEEEQDLSGVGMEMPPKVHQEDKDDREANKNKAEEALKKVLAMEKCQKFGLKTRESLLRA